MKLDAGIVPSEVRGLWYPVIYHDQRIVYMWGWPVTAATAKKRASDELELRQWLKKRLASGESLTAPPEGIKKKWGEDP